MRIELVHARDEDAALLTHVNSYTLARRDPFAGALGVSAVSANIGRLRRGRQLRAAVLAMAILSIAAPATAQSVLFDFDSAPLHGSLPLDQSAGGITAHLSASGDGYSIQEAGVLGFTPVGFAGYAVYPNSVFAADLMVAFSAPVSDFSILYAVNELACDSSATLEVTGYAAASFVASNTQSAVPGATWPTAVLSLSAASGFDNVVVHYKSPPPFACDWGPNFMADNMQVTPLDPIFANGFD
jgi:hypothetical protein